MASESGLFERFVEPGRLCMIPHLNKVVVIVDIIDQNRVLIDGPTSDVPRQQVPLKHIQLTDVVVKNVQRGCRTRGLLTLLEAQGSIAKFNESEAGKKQAAQAFRTNMTDFERFKLMVAHKRRRTLIREAMKAH